MRVLLIEDDLTIASPLVRGLEREGLAVQHVECGADARAALAAAPPDVVLLDLGLPDVDGFELCREVRAGSSVPIIVVTARGEEIDRVVGLELGADDYVVKPFGFRELVALLVDRRPRRALVDDQPVILTPKEFDLLALLADDPGAVCSRQRILDEVWDPHWYGPTKTLDVHIASLRRKLGHPELIETVRGVGYRLCVPEAAA